MSATCPPPASLPPESLRHQGLEGDRRIPASAEFTPGSRRARPRGNRSGVTFGAILASGSISAPPTARSPTRRLAEASRRVELARDSATGERERSRAGAAAAFVPLYPRRTRFPGGLDRSALGSHRRITSTGKLAQRRGAEISSRLVSSAKSWLSYSAVDRTAAMLPWKAAEGVPRISPVEASAEYLKHLRAAWD